MWNFPLFPDQAVEHWRGQVDALCFFELAVAAFFTALIFLLIVTFAVAYRRGSQGRPLQPADCTASCMEVALDRRAAAARRW